MPGDEEDRRASLVPRGAVSGLEEGLHPDARAKCIHT